MFYFKLLVTFVWMLVCCILGLIYVIPNWGNTNINRDFGKVFAWGTLKIFGIRVKFEGLENIEAHQPCIYIINHQSGLDLAIFGLIYPQHTLIIGKRELLFIPFFGIFFLAAGNIIIDRKKVAKAVAGLNQGVEAVVDRKKSIWIFPEGTRNRVGEGLLPFKRGAFHMAIQAGVPLVPIVGGSLAQVADWKRRKAKGGEIRVRVLPPISVEGFTENRVDELVAIAQTKMTEAFQSIS